MAKQVMPIAHVKVDLCKFCEHEYVTPCHGKDKECANRRFIEGGGAMIKTKQRDPVPAAPEKKAAAKKKLREVHIMDDVDAAACTKCGSNAWIVDGAGDGKRFWLLCIDPKGVGCIECQELPADVRVVE